MSQATNPLIAQSVINREARVMEILAGAGRRGITSTEIAGMIPCSTTAVQSILNDRLDAGGVQRGKSKHAGRSREFIWRLPVGGVK